MREDYSPVQAEAYKVTIAIKILEVEGLALAQMEIPAIKILHLVVHPNQADPTKVATVTKLAPEALSEPHLFAPTATDANKGIFHNVLDAHASLKSTLRSSSPSSSPIDNRLHCTIPTSEEDEYLDLAQRLKNKELLEDSLCPAKPTRPIIDTNGFTERATKAIIKSHEMSLDKPPPPSSPSL
ncbi:uncharacterized protein VP01_3810g1 [Puccinia sorghi]|uniref:Uncharacterized protein n=1 Tax=Puccinia sorghi TaxID=27349 RepID=A0A0L6UTB1_9BASI|nr:uncharacterized protein VP01_3810g1 [Puccinia sorghi]